MCLFRRHISNRNAARDGPHQTCTGTKKTQVLNFKVRQTCTGTKKTKVLNFKVHQTCTGTKKTKKNKNFRGILAPSQVDWKVFVFFVFFVPVQVWCTLKFKTFVFFVPVQVWCTLKFKTCVFFVPVQVWCTSKFKTRMQLFISIVILFLLFANVLDTCATFCFPCSFLKGQVRFSCKGFTI